jgi:hypothetical protein
MAISNPNGHYQGPNNQRSDAADYNAKPNYVHGCPLRPRDAEMTTSTRLSRASNTSML